MFRGLSESYESLRKKFRSKSYIQLTDNAEMIIYNIVKIISADENYMSLKLPKTTVSITGLGLKVTAFDTDSVKITGVINAIEFSASRPETKGGK